MQIISTSTDKNSDMHYCCWADVKEGRIQSIYDETGREGGRLWSREHNPNCDKRLLETLKSLARNWPNWYAKVREAAHLESIPTLRSVKASQKTFDVARLENGIDYLKKKLNEKETELRKVKRRKIS